MNDGFLENVFHEKVKEINEVLRTKENQKLSNREIRRLVEGSVGQFKIVDRGAAAAKYTENGVLAVDGSIGRAGAYFPYVLSFVRAVAINTKEDTMGNAVKLEEVICPLISDDRAALERLLSESENLISLENAYNKYSNDKMAELELKSAMRGVERFGSKVVLIDGGFYRFGITCPELWDEFKEFCMTTGTLAVGVIEEVSTHKMSRLLVEKLPDYMHFDYDRELLYGVLRQGEWLKVNEDIEIKKGYYTAFARFSSNPQVIGLDIFKEQVDEVEDAVQLVAGLTAQKSRGVPVLVDIVDKAARVTQREVGILLGMMDLDIKEKFIVSQHERRVY